MRNDDYLITCDYSGFVCKKSETRKMWNGLIVRKDFWEPRHPQDFIPSIPERPGPKEVRMDQEDPPLDSSNWYYDLLLSYEDEYPYEAAYTFDASMII